MTVTRYTELLVLEIGLYTRALLHRKDYSLARSLQVCKRLWGSARSRVNCIPYLGGQVELRDLWSTRSVHIVAERLSRSTPMQTDEAGDDVWRRRPFNIAASDDADLHQLFMEQYPLESPLMQ